jgi:cell wall-associated NlpC family hydrolase
MAKPKTKPKQSGASGKFVCAAVVAVVVYQAGHTAGGWSLTAAIAAVDRAAGSLPYADHGSGLGQRIVAEAKTERGTPYSWGGGNVHGESRGSCCSPGGYDGRKTVGYDCSGLVLYAAFQASGGRIRLPRTAAEQVKRGTPVSRANMRPGDLIGFDHRDGHGVTHIGIYIGHGQMINAPQTGDVVKISPLAPRNGQRWVIRRLEPPDG